jgi:hypothetical protein
MSQSSNPTSTKEKLGKLAVGLQTLLPAGTTEMKLDGKAVTVASVLTQLLAYPLCQRSCPVS